MATAGVCTPVRTIESGRPLVMPAGTIKRVHVDQHIIRANKSKGTENPVITVQWRGRSFKVASINIAGPSTVVYSPHKALSCGAHVWVETLAQIDAIT